MAKRQTAAPPVLPGYSYIRPLGSGGFADVFLYEQDMPRRVVAVKVLVSDVVDPEVLRTFNAEADILARLSAHPSIVTIHLASVSADGRPFFVMEYCPDTMSARYRRGPLPLGEVLDAGVRIAAALETAHRSGLLHRDIKPSNILVSSLGSPVLADFGIAAALSDDESGLFAMSVPWSSPEVIQERTTGTVASEVWSLAATLYTMLAGRSPFELETREKNARDVISKRIVQAGWTPIGRADVPERVERVLRTAMSRDPAKRQPSMQALAEELRWAQYEAGLPPTAVEVAAAEWARAAAPIDFADDRARGPVVSSVRAASRRDRRQARAADDTRPVDRDGLLLSARAPGRSSGLRAALIGGGVGVAVLVLGGVALLVGTGIL